MKKTWLGLLSALMLSTAFGGMATFNASAAVEDVPEALTVSNVALGKDVSFRSLTDMSVEVDWGAYYPDATGFYGKDHGDMTRLTDGNSDWGVAQNRSPQTSGTHAWVYLDLGSSVSIEEIKVGYLAAWCFSNVVIQVSNDATFATDVTTVFASTATVRADDGTTVIYDGGQVNCSVETKAETGWNNFEGVDSIGGLRVYDVNGVSARYVRMTNSDNDNGGSFNVTTINEIQVYAVTGGLVAPKASVASGSYAEMTTVELTAGYDNAEIYYTLDGTYPTKNSTKYEGPIDASAWTGAVALRTITVVDGKQSEAADYVYKLTVPSENVAAGKTVSFRSLTDMNTEIAGGSYYPDAQGFYGDMFGTMASLTDGVANWGSAQNRSPQTRGTHAWAFLDLGKEIEIENIQVGYLAAWCFENVVIQVSNDPTFATGVTTIFACIDQVLADDGTTVIYDGGQVGCSEETRALTGWNLFTGVDSSVDGLRIYAANGVKARYVRLTNKDGGNGGSFDVTTISELQVWSKGGATVADPEIKDTVKSVTAIENTLEVIPGTSLEGVKALLPATVEYTTMKGATAEIALTWESADWAEMTEGTFTFTASVSAISVDDVFDVVPVSYSVAVTVNKADTSALDALIKEVEELNSTTYTAKTWSPLATLVAEAEEAISVITVTEETIAGYVDSITAAKAALKELATDKTELAAAVATAGAIEKANYMSATVAGLDAALETATTVNNDTDASVEEVTAALSALNTVLNGLVEKGDTTALATLVNEIKEANYVEDNYTELTYATLVDALAAAEVIVEAAETPKTQVEAAYTALENAKNGLVAYGNNAELAALVLECGALTQADYTLGSWATFGTELTEASALLTQKVMQDAIDAAKAELQTAKNNLVSIVALKAAIASTIDETAYTAISVQVWKDAKAEAQLVLDNPAATAQEVAAAVTAIETAQNALVEKPADNSSNSASNSAGNSTEDKDSSKDDQNGLSIFGCGGVIDAASASLVMAGVAIVALLKKKKD